MKLLKHSGRGFKYELEQIEADVLVALVKKFPLTGMEPAKISRTDREPAASEREKLLNESLAEHRRHLQQQALKLFEAGKLKQSEAGCILTLTPGSREILLQILNDLRIGCWRALGEPEVLERPPAQPTARELAGRNLMELAGEFEYRLLEPGEAETGG